MSSAAARSLCSSLRLAPAAPDGRRSLFAAAAGNPPACRPLLAADAAAVSLLAVDATSAAAEPVRCLCNDLPHAILLLEGQLIAAGDVHIRITADQIIPAGRTLTIEHTLIDAPTEPALEIRLRSVPASARDIVTGIGAPGRVPARASARRAKPKPSPSDISARGEPVGCVEPLPDGSVRISAACRPGLVSILNAAAAIPDGDQTPLAWPEDLLDPAAWTTSPLLSGAIRCGLERGGTRLATLVWQNSALVLRGVLSPSHARLMSLA